MKSEIERIADYPKIPISDGTKIIYVAGAYRAKTEEQKRENVWHATRVSVRLWELGWIVFSPINNSAYFDVYSSLPDEVWLKGSLKFLEFCQAIFMLSNWLESTGAKRELERAVEMGLSVYYEDRL